MYIHVHIYYLCANNQITTVSWYYNTHTTIATKLYKNGILMFDTIIYINVIILPLQHMNEAIVMLDENGL